jgi:hypothetical protein
MQPALLQSEMQDVASIHAVSLGKRAVGLTSGKAINALAENDMSQLTRDQLRRLSAAAASALPGDPDA